jgi:hypothetical protein
MTIYNIIGDIGSLQSLINELTDEETGETRELTDEDKAQFLEWIQENEKNFKGKFDNLCRVYKNQKAYADFAEAERKSLSDEMSRLSKRAKARSNEGDRIKCLIGWALDKIGEKKYETELFSAGYQNTAKSAKPTAIFNPDKIPVQYLKRELSPSAISNAVKDGALYEHEDIPIQRGSLFYIDKNGDEQKLHGVSYLNGTALVIR